MLSYVRDLPPLLMKCISYRAKADLSDNTASLHTFDEMLADIDAMVSHLPGLAKAIGISIPRIAIGGSSAGGHLSLLYAYDGANPSVLGLGLKHSVPVACVFSDCGPSDLASRRARSRNGAGCFASWPEGSTGKRICG